jgi:3-deoxy-manno-octulosonate cytidylyltransferase (CMP-KDO synthetase)
MRILGIIPARFASTRFPGKVLADIRGKSMIQRVYEQALLATTLHKVIVATDDERVKLEAERFHAEVVMTKSDHISGTDRCQEAYQKLGEPFDFIINIQGDEPFIKPEQIDTLVKCLTQESELATLIKKIEEQSILQNTGNVKVVFNTQMEALYFSRQPIPFLRGISPTEWLSKTDYYEHVGLYAYRVDVLQKICSLQPSTLELAESLEQLRWLENGFRIKVQPTEWDSYCIETPEDLTHILQLIK